MRLTQRLTMKRLSRGIPAFVMNISGLAIAADRMVHIYSGDFYGF
jgi:hypothetical protein